MSDNQQFLDSLTELESKIGTPEAEAAIAQMPEEQRQILATNFNGDIGQYVNFSRELMTSGVPEAVAAARGRVGATGRPPHADFMAGLINQWKADTGEAGRARGYDGSRNTNVLDRLAQNQGAADAVAGGLSWLQIRGMLGVSETIQIVDPDTAIGAPPAGGPTGQPNPRNGDAAPAGAPAAPAARPAVDKAAAGVAATPADMQFHRVRGTGDYTVAPRFDHDAAMRVFGDFSTQGANGIIDVADFDTRGEIDGLQRGLAAIGLYPEEMVADGKVGPYTMYGASALNGYAQMTQAKLDNTVDAAKQAQINAFYDRYKGADGRLTVEDFASMPAEQLRTAQTELTAMGLEVGGVTGTFNPRMAGGIGWVAGAQAGLTYAPQPQPNADPNAERPPVAVTGDGQSKIVLVVDDSTNNGLTGGSEAERNRQLSEMAVRNGLNPDNIVVVPQSSITNPDGSLNSQRFGDIIGAAGADADGARVAYLSTDTLRETGRNDWGDQAGFVRTYGSNGADEPIIFDDRNDVIYGKDHRGDETYNRDARDFLGQMRDAGRTDPRIAGAWDAGVVVAAYTGDDTKFTTEQCYTDGRTAQNINFRERIESDFIGQLRGNENAYRAQPAPVEVVADAGMVRQTNIDPPPPPLPADGAGVDAGAGQPRRVVDGFDRA